MDWNNDSVDVTPEKFEWLLVEAEWGDTVTAWHMVNGTYVVEGGPTAGQRKRVKDLASSYGCADEGRFDDEYDEVV